MNDILKNTHKSENIQLLKARDYYFDKARKLNRLKWVLVLFPPVLLVLSYFFRSGTVDNIRDLVIGILSIALYIVIQFPVERAIEKNLVKSNALREKYDCLVFGLEPNLFAYPDADGEKISDAARKAKVKDESKYEVWYGEIFCKDRRRNVLCCQLDNVVYTYCVYSKVKFWIIVALIAVPVFLLGSLVGFSFGFGHGGNWIDLIAKPIVLGAIALFNVVQVFISQLCDVNGLIAANKDIMDEVKDGYKDVCAQLDGGNESILRTLQDVIINNRNKSIFIPSVIRNKYLAEGCEFYRKLNEFKALYWDDNTTDLPSCAGDIEIFNTAETATVNLDDVHERLLEMMKKVARAFEEEGIDYALDGGSLIGAVRSDNTQDGGKVNLTTGKFIFWDDDIDIALPVTDNIPARAKKAILKHCPDDFEIQDYSSDESYSPRLSNFRIRDKHSIVTEKDSKLYKRYGSCGLFIDVYFYSPVLHSKFVDALYRKIKIHSLYKRILRTEEKVDFYALSSAEKDKKRAEKAFLKFKKQKREYLKRVDWYSAHAKNDKYLAYLPNYIYNLKKAGPYIDAADYFPVTQAKFENLVLPVPKNPDVVLEKYYGKWYISPFRTKEQLQSAADNPSEWFSGHVFRTTVMKHIGRVDM